MPIAIFLVPLIERPNDRPRWIAKYSRPHTRVKTMPFSLSAPDLAFMITETTQAQIDFIKAQPDAIFVADKDNIDDVLTAGQITAIGNLLESNFIGNTILQSGDTRRDALRKILRLFQFSRRMGIKYGKGIKHLMQSRGITLNSTWSEFPQALKNEFIAIRDSYNLDVQQMGISNSSTLREIMGAIAEVMDDNPIQLGDITL